MKSRILLPVRTLSLIRSCIQTSREDKITVYAAQASFFVITSAIPFLSLLLSLAGIFLPESDVRNQYLNYLPDTISDLIKAPGVPLLSISAVTALWTASRGISAVRAGIENVYRASVMEGFFRRRIRSIFSTVFFILIIVASAAVMLFGNLILRLIPENISLAFNLTLILGKLRTPFFIGFMTVVFTSVYVSAASRSQTVSSSVLAHIPGALLSSAGWVLFSLGYSLYLEHFPRASAIYGSLAAICLIMLWLYFCMVILLFGAVYNKLRLMRRFGRGNKANGAPELFS